MHIIHKILNFIIGFFKESGAPRVPGGKKVWTPKRVVTHGAIAIFIIHHGIELLLLGFFCYYRWGMYDDALQLQGKWYVSDTSIPIEITKEDIELSNGNKYTYEVDSESKTIMLTYDDKEGHVHYRFSLDRTTVALVDGNISWLESLLDDFFWTIKALVGELFHNDVALEDEGTKGVTILEKKEDDTAWTGESSKDDDSKNEEYGLETLFDNDNSNS
ncbi:MAG: hypothetical protein LUB61_01755 [Eggerthellaceae bacterium]|nr:hypothetical protein [Eggerthellaceae bacterium]